MNLINAALVIAYNAHLGQYRKYYREPYITHPIRVAEIVRSYVPLDEISIAAALLHDVIEDTKVDRKEIIFRLDNICKYGVDPQVYNEVVSIVEDLTHDYTEEEAKGLTREQKRERDWAKLKTVSNKAKLIKMADRLDNLSSGMPVKLLHKYATESKELHKICAFTNKALANQLERQIEMCLETFED